MPSEDTNGFKKDKLKEIKAKKNKKVSELTKTKAKKSLIVSFDEDSKKKVLKKIKK